MKIIIILVVALSLSNINAQIRWQNLVPVEEADPLAPALKKWKQSVAARYQQGGIIVPIFKSQHELPFKSLKLLFPNHRFFTISWSETPAKGKEKDAIGLALDLGVTLVCNDQGKIIKEVSHSGNYEAFGELLSSMKVAIRNNEDARIVWQGFCDLHQKHWKDQRIERKSDRVWHLGVTTIDDFHYYYQINVDESGNVVSGKLHANKIKQKS